MGINASLGIMDGSAIVLSSELKLAFVFGKRWVGMDS